MRLTKAKIENFGTLDSPVELVFGAGLNVIHGPNEAGKSTLLEALWTALSWDPTTGASEIESMFPHTGGNPEILLEFEHDGETYRLEKRFVPKRGKARLTVESPDGETAAFQDEEVEHRLRESLGFGHATGNNSYPSHHGLWPLLWVRQWESRRDPAAVDQFEEAGRSSLSEILARETGEVLGGERGQVLLEGAREEYRRFWTKKGSPTSRGDAEIVGAEKAVEEAERERDELRDKLANYEQLIDRYERLGIQADELESALPDWEAKRDRAREKLERLEELQIELDRARTNLEAAENRLETVEERAERRREIRRQITETEEVIEDRRDGLEERQADLEDLESRTPELESAIEDAKRERDAATTDLRKANAALDFLRANERVEELEEAIEKVGEELEKLGQLEKEKNAIDVTDADVDRLEALESDLRDVEATLKAASARVHIDAHRDLDITVGDEETELSEGEVYEEHLHRKTVISLDQIADVRIEPGGRDLGELNDELERKQDEYDTALEEAGVESAREARERARERRELENQIENLQVLLDRIAPEGRNALQTELDEARAVLEEAKSELLEGADEAISDVAPEVEEDARDQIRDAQRALERNRRALEDARTDLEAHRKRRNRLSEEVARAEQEIEGFEDNLSGDGGLHDQLEAHVDAHGGEDALGEAVADAREVRDSARETVERLEEDLEELDPETTRKNAEHFAGVYEKRKSELRDLRRQRNEIRVEIEAGEVDGLHDRIAKNEAELDDRRERLRRLRRKANAAKLLLSSLTTARQQLQRAFLKPLRQRTTELVQRLFPESRVGFDDGFQVKSLTRKQTITDEFGALSAGTSEQIGILVRLALARLVNEQEAFPLVLDDPFVATDRSRFEAMLPILVEAADDLQILLTTCHWNRYRALDAPSVTTHDLEKLTADSLELA